MKTNKHTETVLSKEGFISSIETIIENPEFAATATDMLPRNYKDDNWM